MSTYYSADISVYVQRFPGILITLHAMVFILSRVVLFLHASRVQSQVHWKRNIQFWSRKYPGLCSKSRCSLNCNWPFCFAINQTQVCNWVYSINLDVFSIAIEILTTKDSSSFSHRISMGGIKYIALANAAFWLHATLFGSRNTYHESANINPKK